MEIHTIAVVKRLKGELKPKRKIKILLSGTDVFENLPTEGKIICLLKRRGLSTTRDLYPLLAVKGRATRKCLKNLEQDGHVKRIKGNVINESFRVSDSWILASNNKILSKIPKNKIGLFYQSAHYNKGFKNHLLYLPSQIDPTTLALIMGLFDAEGSKTKFKTIEFTNSEPDLIKVFLKFFEASFDIPSTDWKWRISFKQRFMESNNHPREEAAKLFWIKTCNLDPMKIGSITYTGKIWSKSYESKDWGTLSLSLNNLLLTRFFFLLLRIAKKNILAARQLSKLYIDGFMSGEACVCRRQLQVASIDEGFLRSIKDSLTKFNIAATFAKPTINTPKRLLINGRKSLLVLSEIIFTYEPFKKRKLLFNLLRYKSLPPKNKALITQKLKAVERYLEKRKRLFELVYNSPKNPNSLRSEISPA